MTGMKSRISSFVIGSLLVGLSAAAVCAESKNIRIERDREKFETTIMIQTDAGRVAWSDIARGLARAKGLEESALDGVLPRGSFDLRKTRYKMMLVAMNYAFGPHIHWKPDPTGPTSSEWALRITLDDQASLASRRRFKDMLRGRVAKLRFGDGPTYGLEFDRGWERTPQERPLVVLMHGYNSSPKYMSYLADPIRQDGSACATLRYPNDQELDRSAELLSRELKSFAREHAGRMVTLVTHSMGGLVARACIENKSLDPGNVGRLIMVAPPTHGSRLAHFAYGSDLFEHFQWNDLDVGCLRRCADSFEDGLGEAEHDLKPGSIFLTKLNSRQRNPNVRYSIILGTRASWTQADVLELRAEIARQARNSRVVKLFSSNVDRWLADMDEVVHGKGDGVVSVRRGRLEGVADTVVLPFEHMATDASLSGVLQLQKAVVTRLAK